jgi:hypothetical protein
MARQYILSSLVLVGGVALSFVLRGAVNSQTGLTFTTPKATYFLGWNFICFWTVLVLTVVLSAYFVIHRSRSSY